MSIEDDAAKIALSADLMASAQDELMGAAKGAAAVAIYRTTLAHQGVPVKEARDLTLQFAHSYWIKMFGLGCGCQHE